MINTELQEIHRALRQAQKSEEVFGLVADGVIDLPRQDALVEERYRELSAIIDPQAYTASQEKELAQAAKEALDRFYTEAKQLIAFGGYGAGRQNPELRRKNLAEFRTANGVYLLGEPIIRGDHATIFDGEYLMGYDGEKLVGNEAVHAAIKITDDPTNNNLILREARALKQFHEHFVPQRKHLPLLLDQFQTEDNRLGLVLRYLDDCHDLYEVRENRRYENGMDRKGAVSFLKRVLSVLGYVHSQGWLHANLDPSHLMARLPDHNLFLVGWGHAVFAPKKTGETFTVFNEEFSAPEVKTKAIALPSADIYSAGMCMIYLLGGDVAAKAIPDNVEDELARFLGSMVMESPLQRPQDAWLLHNQLETLVKRLWGKYKFIELTWD